MQSLLPLTAPSQQELTLRIFTMSYLHHQTNQKSETYTVKQKVTPKQGRVVLFDGGLMHTAEQPINSNVRCIVNYDLI